MVEKRIVKEGRVYVLRKPQLMADLTYKTRADQLRDERNVRMAAALTKIARAYAERRNV